MGSVLAIAFWDARTINAAMVYAFSRSVRWAAVRMSERPWRSNMSKQEADSVKWSSMPAWTSRDWAAARQAIGEGAAEAANHVVFLGGGDCAGVAGSRGQRVGRGQRARHHNPGGHDGQVTAGPHHLRSAQLQAPAGVASRVPQTAGTSCRLMRK